MKKSNIVIAICMVVICVIGWFTVGSQLMKQSSLYSDYVKEADAWVERGLYQRAISNYNLAMEEKETEELYIKINTAYKLRYEEAPDETIDDYMDFLEIAVAAHPANKELVDSFVDIYFIESKYEEIYNCLIAAIDGGYDTEEVRTELRKARYAFKLRRSEFSGLKQSTGEFYSAGRNQGWNVYCVEDGYLLTNEYDYVSCVNDEGMVVATGKDSRILDTSGMVYGIFKGKVTDASLFEDGLVAACVDGIYSYYDDLADKGSEKILRQRRYARQSLGRRGPDGGGRRVRRHCGDVGQRQKHAAAYAGRAGSADVWQRDGGRQGDLCAERGSADDLPPAQDRVRVPKLQPGTGAERL